MNLYELTRKLVARGCPEHPRLSVGYDGGTRIWVLQGDSGDTLELAASIAPPRESPGESADARALWTMHAMEWCWREGIKHINFYSDDGGFGVGGGGLEPADYDMDALAAIEAATRHLEAK